MQCWRIAISFGYRYCAVCPRCDRLTGWRNEKGALRHMLDLTDFAFVDVGVPEPYTPGDNGSCSCALDDGAPDDA